MSPQILPKRYIIERQGEGVSNLDTITTRNPSGKLSHIND